MDEINRVGNGGGWDVEECFVGDLLHLPHKIQQHHDVEDLAHLVLHDLGHDNHFGLDKAIYLVDNPEFNCLKGVAGFSKCECPLHRENVWEAPHAFSHDMREAEFHNNMKKFMQDASVRKHDIDVHNPDDLLELGVRLGLKNPSFFTWGMRHGNHGILLFEDVQTTRARRRDLLSNAASLLSLC